MQLEDPAPVADGPAFYEEMLRHAQLSQVVGVAADWRIADWIAEGSDDVRSLAARVGCEPHQLRRLLRVLASAGILTPCGCDRYELTTRGSVLRSGADTGMRNTMTWWGGYRWPVWAHLALSLRSGKGSRGRALGSDGFDHLDTNSEAASAFHAAMAELARQLGARLARVYDLAHVRTVVDVGGGDGTLLSALLGTNHAVNGILFDRPHAAASARSKLAARGLAGRCEVAAGDFFQSVPAGADLYISNESSTTGMMSSAWRYAAAAAKPCPITRASW